MKFIKLTLVAVCLSCLLQSGCTDKKKIERLENANQSLRAESQNLRDRLDDSSKQLAQTKQELEQAKAQVNTQRAEISRLQTQNQETAAKLAELTPTPTGATRKAISHEEFNSKVMGMTPQQLVAYVGKPLATSSDRLREYWDYNGITYDSVTGKPDRRVQVSFTNGHVDGAIFIP